MATLECTIRLNGEAKAVEKTLSFGAGKTVEALAAAAGFKASSTAVYFAGGVPVAGDKVLSECGTPLPVFSAGRSGITLEEVARHKSDSEGSWMVLDAGRVFNEAELGLRTWVVYDITEYLDDHPGGKNIMLTNSGACPGGATARARHSPTTRTHSSVTTFGPFPPLARAPPHRRQGRH
jgi:hypothetical protein